MPPPVPPPNFVPPPSSHGPPKMNGLLTAKSTSHHESMGHAIITSTSFLNTVNHPVSNFNHQNGMSRGPPSSALPQLPQDLSPILPPHLNEPQQSHNKPFQGNAHHQENGISPGAPVPAPRTGSMGQQLQQGFGPMNFNSTKAVPNIASSRSNSNASGAAVSPTSGGEGSCSSNSPGGGVGYPTSNPSGSVCSSTNASTGNSGGRPRPQPIAGTPPPDIMDRCDAKLVQQTCSMFGLDMVRNILTCNNHFVSATSVPMF